MRERDRNGGKGEMRIERGGGDVGKGKKGGKNYGFKNNHITYGWIDAPGTR